MSGKVDILPPQVELNLCLLLNFLRPKISHFKELKTVPQAVPKSMRQDLSGVMVFGMLNPYSSEVFVLRPNIAILPLVTA